MNRNKSLVILCAGIILITQLFTSCKKFLSAKSDDTLIVPTTLQDLQGLLDDPLRMNSGVTPSFVETAADDYFLMPSLLINQPELLKTVYRWQKFDYNNAGDWSKPYLAVYNCNLVLENIGEISRNENNAAIWDNVKGSALFFRSYYFLWLAWEFAKAYDEASADTDLGIVLKESSDFNSPSIRATVRQTYSKIVADVKEALPLLPLLPQHKYRPSKAAAFGLLARAYWSMRDYNRALLYADSCLKITDELINYNSDPDINGSMSAAAPFRQFNKETIFYTDMSRSFPVLHLSALSRIDSSLFSKYSTNDLRRTGFFRVNAGYQIFKGSYSGRANYNFSGLTTSEMYLIRGECYIRSNDLNKGLADLNKLLQHRYRSGTYNNINENNTSNALEVLLLERRKELLMRGIRWIDIKRLNKENRNIELKRFDGTDTIRLAPNAEYYALPIPDDIIRITGMTPN